MRWLPGRVGLVLIGIFLGIGMSAVGVIASSETLDRRSAYDRGFDRGFNRGFNAGYKAGSNDGRAAGYLAGKGIGRSIGRSQGEDAVLGDPLIPWQLNHWYVVQLGVSPVVGVDYEITDRFTLEPEGVLWGLCPGSILRLCYFPRPR
jgi:hypothetical protein